MGNVYFYPYIRQSIDNQLILLEIQLLFQWNRITHNRYILGKGIIKNLKKQTIVMIFLFLINLSHKGISLLFFLSL